MKKTMLYVFALLAVLMMVVPAFAAAPPYFLNGTINRSDTMAGIVGVTLTLNTTNTTVTIANGFFSFANVGNGTYSVVVTVPNDGYTAPAAFTGLINADSNTTLKRNLTVVTPTVSGVTESSVTRTGAVISWTPSISTIGNRLIYTHDSALTNNLVTSDWSNSTTSPSFTLSGLDIYTTYYYQVQSYNSNNETYDVTENGDFKTLAGNPEDEPEAYDLVVSASDQTPSVLTQLQPQNGFEPTKVIVFGAIIVVLYLVLFSGGKKRRR